MAAPDWPLHNTMSVFAPRSPNDSIRSLHLLDHLESPRLRLDDFHKFHQSPLPASSAQLEHRCVHRKASTANLAAARLRHTDPAAYCFDDPWTPSLILPRSFQSISEPNNSPSSTHHRPVTPRPRTYTASPSLSSSVDTLQSSPFPTPIHQGHHGAEFEDEENWSGSAEPLRTKRKFESLKRAKRLPRRAGGISSSDSNQDALWEVYADIFEVGPGVGTIVQQGDLKKAKSVRFEALEASSSAAAESDPEEVYGTRAGQQTSSTSLSGVDWPLSASHDNWQGTFGHLNTATPFRSPATVLYRGASFDVLNPHASLIIDPQTLETPAEIDGLLESYFEDHDTMQDNTNQGDSSPHVPSESSRRVLYENADDARRNILRIQEQSKPHVTPPPKAMLSDMGTRKGERPFSDPFDLTLSEDGSRNALMSITDVVKEGRQADATSTTARMQPLGLGITDLDETHATSDQTTDPTIKDILADYEYTRVPLSQLETEFEEKDVGTSPSIEHGRGDNSQKPSYGSSYGLISPLQTPETDRSEMRDKAHGTIALPTPPQPVYTGGPRNAGGLHYWTDCSDLPTTEQSYGNTNQLLNITPGEDIQYPPYAPSSPCHPATCVDPAHIHMTTGPIKIYEDPEPYSPIAGSVQDFDDDDKENIPPPDYDPDAASGRMHGDTDFRFPDVDDYSDDDGDLARAMPRSSSFYPDDGESEWITEHGVSQHDLRRSARLSAMSAESYANTSFVDSQYRFSFTPPVAEMPLSPIPDSSPQPSERLEFVGASKAAVTGFDDMAESRRMAIEARISLLESKIAEEQIASSYSGSPKIDLGARRADLTELDRLRGLLPSASRQFVFKASESLGTMKTHAQHKFEKAKTFVRPQYQPKINFRRSAALGRQEAAFNSGSDTRGLLASPDTHSPYTYFGYSESTGTFMTIQQESPLNMRGPATNLWSPFDKDPTNRAINVKSPIGKRAKIVDIEMGLVNSKSKRSHRAAIGSQYEPRDLHLIKTKRMSDAELAARSAGWTMARSQAVGSPMAEGTDWSSSSTYPMLLKPETEVERANRREQKRISKRFVYGCAAFPPLTLLFGLGFFDESIAKLTDGKVKEACAKEKRNALVVFLPLGIIFWAVLVLAIFIMVTITKGRGQANSSPF
ncbi:hypothetical protein Slin14017_G103290 [Septoria linicola]|nr:hypothetical protein Slin14017_G103290 [Septoria linicola]